MQTIDQIPKHEFTTQTYSYRGVRFETRFRGTHGSGWWTAYIYLALQAGWNAKKGVRLDDYWKSPWKDMPFHGGCTFLELLKTRYWNGQIIRSFRAGADWNHCGDSDRDYTEKDIIGNIKRVIDWCISNGYKP
jgi:hypothetical protein